MYCGKGGSWVQFQAVQFQAVTFIYHLYHLMVKVETKTIKISSGIYKEICEYAGELQKELREPVSIDRALTFLFHKRRLSDLAGSWRMSEKEAKEMMKTIKKGWNTWKLKSA